MAYSSRYGNYYDKEIIDALIRLSGGVPNYQSFPIQQRFPIDHGPQRARRPEPPPLQLPFKQGPSPQQLSLFSDPAHPGLSSSEFIRKIVSQREQTAQEAIEGFRQRFTVYDALASSRGTPNEARDFTLSLMHLFGVTPKPRSLSAGELPMAAPTLTPDRNYMYVDQKADYIEERQGKGFTQLGGDVIQIEGEDLTRRELRERQLTREALSAHYGELVEKYQEIKGQHKNIVEVRKELKEHPEDVRRIIEENPRLFGVIQKNLDLYADLLDPEGDPRKIARAVGRELGAEQGRLGGQLSDLQRAGEGIKEFDFAGIDRALARLGGDSAAGISRGYDARSRFWQDVQPPLGSEEQRAEAAAKRVEARAALKIKMTKEATQSERNFFELYSTGKAVFEGEGRPFIAGSGVLKGSPVTARFVNMNQWAYHPTIREWVPVDLMRQINPSFQGNPAGIQAGIEVRPLAQMPEHLLTRSVFNLGPEQNTVVDPLWALMREDPALKNSRRVVGQANREGARLAREEADRQAAKDLVRQRLTSRLEAAMGGGSTITFPLDELKGKVRGQIGGLGLRSTEIDQITGKRLAQEIIAGALKYPEGSLGKPGAPVPKYDPYWYREAWDAGGDSVVGTVVGGRGRRHQVSRPTGKPIPEITGEARNLPGFARGGAAEETYSNLSINYKWALADFMKLQGPLGKDFRTWVQTVAPQLSYEMAQNPQLDADRMVKLLQQSEVLKTIGFSKQAIARHEAVAEEELRQAGGLFQNQTLPLFDEATKRASYDEPGFEAAEEAADALLGRAGRRAPSNMGLIELRQLDTQLREVRQHLRSMRGRGKVAGINMRSLEKRQAFLEEEVRKGWSARDVRYGIAWESQGARTWSRYLQASLGVSSQAAGDIQSFVSAGLHGRSQPFVGTLSKVSDQLTSLRDQDLSFDFAGKSAKLRISRAIELPRFGNTGIAMGKKGIRSIDYDPTRFKVWFELAGSEEERRNTLVALGYTEAQATQAMRGGMTGLSQEFRFQPFKKELGQVPLREAAKKLGIETRGLSLAQINREIAQKSRQIIHQGLTKAYMLEYQQTGAMVHPWETILEGGYNRPYVVRNLTDTETAQRQAEAMATAFLENNKFPFSAEELMKGFRTIKPEVGRLVAAGGLSEMVDILPEGNFQPLNFIDVGPNTVTDMRLLRNNAINQRIMKQYIGGEGSALTTGQRYQTLITSRDLLPQVPEEVRNIIGGLVSLTRGAPYGGPLGIMARSYGPAQEMLEKALLERGVSFGLVESMSRQFGGQLEVSAIRNLPRGVINRINASIPKWDDGREIAHMVVKNNFYSPLSLGAQVQVPGYAQSFPMGALWARANVYQGEAYEGAEIMGQQRLAGIAPYTFDEQLSGLGRMTGKQATQYMADAIAGQDDALRSQEMTELLPEAAINRIRSRLIPVPPQNQMQLFAPPPPPGEVPGAKTAAETTKAAKAADEILTKQPPKKLLDLLKTNKLAGGVALAAAAITGFAYLYRPDKDRTEQDMQGPAFLPGGSAYEPSVVATNRLMAPVPQAFGNPIRNGGGVTYIINSNPYGDNSTYDPAQLSSQIQAMTGAYPTSTIYNSSQSVAQTRERQQNAIVGAY